VRPVLEFCSNDLSALYFDIRKDSLYCDRPDAIRRRAARTVMHEVFIRLTAWLAPLTPFTMEEAWGTRYPDAGSNCARVIPETPGGWRNDAEASRWRSVKNLLTHVTTGIEEARNQKRIGGAIDSAVHITAPTPWLAAFEIAGASRDEFAAEIFRSSLAFLTEAPHGDVLDQNPPTYPNITIESLTTPKCARSWRRVPDVGSDLDYPDLSARDAEAVRWWDARRA